MEFIYPSSRQFPFGEVCEKIVRELAQRNWEVPDIKVRFLAFDTNNNPAVSYFNDGPEKAEAEKKGFRIAFCIMGKDFKIQFNRKDLVRVGEEWRETTGPCEVLIPKKQISVFDDESGPSFCLYVGKDWDKDREAFMNGRKYGARKEGRPKTYLRYTGGCDCGKGGGSYEAVGFMMALIKKDYDAIPKMRHTHFRQRCPVLVPDDYQHSEYDPEGDEPRSFKTAEVLEEFRQYLENTVLPMIVSHPVAEKVGP